MLPAHSQPEVVRHANAFMQVGISGRNEALGRCGLVSDYYLGILRYSASSLVLQPTRWAVGAAYSHQFSGMGQLGGLHLGYRVDSLSVVNLELVRYGVTGIPNTLAWMDSEGEVDWGRVSYFGVADWGLRLGYGRLSPVVGLSWGIALKAIYRHEGNFAQGYGLGLDASLRYARGGLALGVNLYDAVSTWTLWFKDSKRLRVEGGPDTIPPLDTRNAQEVTLPNVTLALEYTFSFPHQFHLMLACRADSYFDGRSYSPLSFGRVSIEPALGIEVDWARSIFIRLGGYRLQHHSFWPNTKTVFLTPTCGLGVQLYGFTLDYSLGMPLIGVTSRYTHLVSAGYAF